MTETGVRGHHHLTRTGRLWRPAASVVRLKAWSIASSTITVPT